ncbi:hypothetical protein ACFS07_00250 [Undibacterium arcticum]
MPVSVNTQGTYLNQIYMGMFRPDASANPRWLGNLKQYQFILNGDNLKLGDASSPTPQLAISSAKTGFISPNAISFWTTKNLAAAPDSTGGFYVNAPNGAGLGFDSPDGELVEKGWRRAAVARQESDRHLYGGICVDAQPLHLLPWRHGLRGAVIE